MADTEVNFSKKRRSLHSFKLVAICDVLLLFVLFYFVVCVVLRVDCLQMCTVQMPQVANPIAVDENIIYINIYVILNVTALNKCSSV
jgi:hypothetical protein